MADLQAQNERAKTGQMSINSLEIIAVITFLFL